MNTILITGVGGLVGSVAAEFFHDQEFRIVGIDNDMRGKLLNDPNGTTQWNIDRLTRELRHFSNHPVDVRDKTALTPILKTEGRKIACIIHCAAQTAHEGEVIEDFQVNAGGTLNLLDLAYRYCPDAVFIYLSTIKVYGHFPNTLTYHRDGSRYDLESTHRYFNGFDEGVPIDQGMSSFFGRSKTSADLYVQEYGYQFGLQVACFRASCLTGGLHSGTEAHGMLSYMMRCAFTKNPYVIYGYDGLQVRDQLHAYDMVTAIYEVARSPKDNMVYNIGGGRAASCSMLEAVEECERLTGNNMIISHGSARKGDHRWWVTDNSRFMRDYPNWKITYSLSDIYEDIHETGKHRW